MAMKTKISPPAAAALAALFCLAGTPMTSAKIVCWKNSEGVRECGNAVPPEYAQQNVERKSHMGITLETKERAKTPEEIAAENATREKLEREEAERERAQARRARRDHVLLRTFTTEEDLMLTRDGKVAAIDSRIRHSEQVILKLQENRAHLEGEAASLERGGSKVPEDLRRKIDDIRTQAEKTRTEIEQRKHERVSVQKQFDEDLARYRKLKGS